MHGIAAITGNMHRSLRYFVLLEHITGINNNYYYYYKYYYYCYYNIIKLLYYYYYYYANILYVLLNQDM